MKLELDRRAFLTGLGGAVVALPFLEAMLPRRAYAAAGAPLRYVAMFAGIEQKACIPSGTGTTYTMPAGLTSLEAVRDHVSIITNLEVPASGAGPTPPGGKANPHHGNIMKPLLTGMRSTKEDHGVVESATADQIVADMFGVDTHFRSLEYCAQPDGYRSGDAGLKTVMSYGAGGSARIPQSSPRLAWEAMFTNFSPSNPADLEAKQKLLERRLSVLDLVKARGDRLIAQASGYDRQRLERHFDEIRDLEKRLADIPDTSGAGCDALPDPGADPGETSHPNTAHGGTTGYTDEDKRASVFVDLIHMALVCDLTRVATLMINFEQSTMSLEPLWGAPYEMHDVTHNDIPDRIEVWNGVTSWQAGFFARLVQKLVDTPEASGGTLLDDTVVVFTSSGGQSGHGSNDMAMPIAGRPSVLRMGEHIVAPSGAHPANVFQTAMHALGIDHDLGEVAGLVGNALV
ncbi:MAG TPA: DUF1552 domain-containing protein [Nannocystaceae bacterium]|nr:DUF1552 domain-containing protein [Nannocystaceae bacterium]